MQKISGFIFYTGLSVPLGQMRELKNERKTTEKKCEKITSSTHPEHEQEKNKKSPKKNENANKNESSLCPFALMRILYSAIISKKSKRWWLMTNQIAICICHEINIKIDISILLPGHRYIITYDTWTLLLILTSGRNFQLIFCDGSFNNVSVNSFYLHTNTFTHNSNRHKYTRAYKERIWFFLCFFFSVNHTIWLTISLFFLMVFSFILHWNDIQMDDNDKWK